jgi:hypothetical protein
MRGRRRGPGDASARLAQRCGELLALGGWDERIVRSVQDEEGWGVGGDMCDRTGRLIGRR